MGARRRRRIAGVKIGVLSDTHIPEAGEDMPPQAYEALAGVDLIVHCGDLHDISIVDRLERVAPVLVSRGNGDTPYPMGRRPGVPEDPRIADCHVLDLGGFRVGVTHDLEAVEGRPDEFAIELVRTTFGAKVDIALCGHTHIPLTWGLTDGTAILNPGSPTMPWGYPKIAGTLGLLTLETAAFRFEVVDLHTGGLQFEAHGPGPSALQKGVRPRHHHR
jgi:putative phosphoesterase